MVILFILKKGLYFVPLLFLEIKLATLMIYSPSGNNVTQVSV